MYRAKEKLFYKFIANEPIFAYDDTGMLSLNSANIVIPHVQGYSTAYIMAILNSTVISYYYKHKYRSVKVLRSAIEELPIAECDVDTMNLISELALSIAHGINASENSANRLNSLIMDLYGISAYELL